MNLFLLTLAPPPIQATLTLLWLSNVAFVQIPDDFISLPGTTLEGTNLQACNSKSDADGHHLFVLFQ